MRYICEGVLVPILVLFSPSAFAQQGRQRAEADLQKRLDQLELEVMKLRAESSEAAPSEEIDVSKTFKGHGRALQGLNPELSIIGDAWAGWLWTGSREYTDDRRSGFHLREVELAFESALDPFSYMKANLSFEEDGIDKDGHVPPQLGLFRQSVWTENREGGRPQTRDSPFSQRRAGIDNHHLARSAVRRGGRGRGQARDCQASVSARHEAGQGAAEAACILQHSSALSQDAGCTRTCETLRTARLRSAR